MNKDYQTGDMVVHDGFQAELIESRADGYWIVDTKTWGLETWHETDFEIESIVGSWSVAHDDLEVRFCCGRDWRECPCEEESEV